MKTEIKKGTKVQCHRGDLRGQVGTVARTKSGTEMVVEFFLNGQSRKVIVSKSNWRELNLSQCGERDDARKECEANIAHFRAMIQSLSCRVGTLEEDEEREANHHYYCGELKAWKERLEKINKANGVSNSNFINTAMSWAD